MIYYEQPVLPLLLLLLLLRFHSRIRGLVTLPPRSRRIDPNPLKITRRRPLPLADFSNGKEKKRGYNSLGRICPARAKELSVRDNVGQLVSRRGIRYRTLLTFLSYLPYLRYRQKARTVYLIFGLFV